MFAYFDAGTGSMIMTAVAAGAAGIAVVGKTFWYKIAFWKKPAADSNVDEAVEVDTSELDDADDLDVGEIDDSELEIS